MIADRRHSALLSPACPMTHCCRSLCRLSTEYRCDRPDRDQGRRCRAEKEADPQEGEPQVARRGESWRGFCPAPGFRRGCSASSAHERRGQRCLVQRRGKDRWLSGAIDGRSSGRRKGASLEKESQPLILYGQEDPGGGAPNAIRATSSHRVNSCCIFG